MLRRRKPHRLAQFHRRQKHLDFAEFKAETRDFNFEVRPFQFSSQKFGIREERFVQLAISGKKISLQDASFPIYL